MKTKEEILLEVFNNYGSFITIDDIKTGFNQSPGQSMFLILEAMEAYANQFRSEAVKSGWISVNDGLPKNRESVLCFNGFGMVQNSWEAYTDQNKEWFKSRFTHWRPLPPKPATEAVSGKPTIKRSGTIIELSDEDIARFESFGFTYDKEGNRFVWKPDNRDMGHAWQQITR